jgi:predicted amidohydrolase
VLFELREGEFRLDDAYGHSRTASSVLEPVTVVKSGSIYRQRNPR